MTGMYRVKVKGTLDEQWSDWFNGMTIEVERMSDGTSTTTLTGHVADQARLRGMVSKIWDMNLTLVSVIQLEGGANPDHSHQEGVKDGKTVENGMA
jgi:hypothetical protein